MRRNSFTCCAAFLLHLITFVSSSNNITMQIIHVNANGSSNYHDCPTSFRGCSLTAAFRAVENKFNRHTKVLISPGHYMLNTSASFKRVDDLTITSVAEYSGFPASVTIRCEGNTSGLAFFNCNNTKIRGISFESCGKLYHSSSYGRPLFYSAIFIQENVDFELKDLAIRNSLGVGITIYDTTGDVIIDSVAFEGNGPIFLNCQFASSLNLNKIANAGGGLYVELTHKSNATFSRKSNYRILQSNFTGNNAPYSGLLNYTFKRPGGLKHVSFSRGGGLSLFLRGTAQDNTFLIDSCIFKNNSAIWGGGYFFQFLDTSSGNNIVVKNTKVTGNSACLGGGAFQISGISSNENSRKLTPNTLQSNFCWFSVNSAVSGGGGAIFGRTSFGSIDYSYHFNNCTWESNEAVIGFALTLKLRDYDKGLFGPNSPFRVKLSDCDVIANKMTRVSLYGWGVGAIYDFLVPLTLKNVRITENTNTSLVIDTSSVTILENVTFSRNIGYKGGAVAMYGEASFTLRNNSRLYFDSNEAKEMGGAIFVETPGPDTIPSVTRNYLQTHQCFFKYEDSTKHPDEWRAQVFFIENCAPLDTGYSIFTNSLRDCLYSSENFSDVLNWNSFHYLRKGLSNSSGKNVFEVVTDAVQIHAKTSHWKVAPNEIFSPEVILLDEKNNSVYGMVHVSIKTKEKSAVSLGTPSSLFLAKHKISSIDLNGISGSNYSVEIRTVGGQFAQKTLNNLVLQKCKPGFVQKGKQCVCATVDRFPGVSRCDGKKGIVFIVKGYWAGEVQSKGGENKFVTAQCPAGFCYCYHPENFSVRTDECVYDETKMCLGNRKGVLCGSCVSGYSVKVGAETCSAECGNSDLWRLAPLLVGLTLMVIFIFLINRDIFTCYMNVWLYFYQVVILITGVHEEISLDPFMKFIIGLAQITISGFGSCMWKGMDNLNKLLFSYLLPVYVFVVVLIIGFFARRFPNSYFAKNSTFRASCTLFVLCYSTLTRVSMDILRPSKVGDEIVVFYQGSVPYFSAYHCRFAVLAILILLFIVIPFPLLLALTPFFSKHLKWVGYVTPLLSTFKSCFKDEYRWFAAFYFFLRFVFLLFATFMPYGEAKAIVMQISTVFVLAVHVNLCPYLPQYNWINKFDSLHLVTLTVISVIAGQITKNTTESTKNTMVKCIDVFTYIPLLYVVCLAVYVFSAWLRSKVGLRKENSPELINHDSIDPSTAPVKVV